MLQARTRKPRRPPRCLAAKGVVNGVAVAVAVAIGRAVAARADRAAGEIRPLGRDAVAVVVVVIGVDGPRR